MIYINKQSDMNEIKDANKQNKGFTQPTKNKHM